MVCCCKPARTLYLSTTRVNVRMYVHVRMYVNVRMYVHVRMYVRVQKLCVGTFVVVVLLGLISPSVQTGGIAVTLSTIGVNYVLQHFVPVIEHKIENTTIPGISGTVRGLLLSVMSRLFGTRDVVPVCCLLAAGFGI
jgi:hypothetical protein